MPGGWQPPPEVPAHPEHQRARRERQARAQRAVAQPALQVQREAEQEPAVGDHQHRHRGQARHQAGRAQHGQVQQRIAAPVRDPPFHAHEHRGQHQPEGDAREYPPRPVLLVTQHQRQHHEEHRGHGDGQPGQIQLPSAGRLVPRHDAGHQGQHGQPDRHVDQEHRPPRLAEQVRGHQHPADHLPGHEPGGQHGRVGAQRPGPGRAVEPHLDDAHDLWHHRRRADPLDEPGPDQHPDARRDPAGQRGQGEDGDPGHEHPSAPVQVTQPRAGDQHHRVAHGVTGDDQLKLGPGRVQRPPDRGHRDVDDRDVKQRHELPGQQHDQHEPAPPRGRGRTPYQWISNGGHDSSLRPDR
jgi:hypothetical protein